MPTLSTASPITQPRSLTGSTLFLLAGLAALGACAAVALLLFLPAGGETRGGR